MEAKRITTLFCIFAICIFTFTTCRGILSRYNDNNNAESRFLYDESQDDETKTERALYNLPKNGELFEGDIVMDDRLRRNVWGVESKKSALRESVVDGLKWPGGVVYYEIEEEFPLQHRKMLAEAMGEFVNRTCISFRKRRKEKDYVVFSSKRNECSSNIGRSGGRQVIMVGPHCMVLGTFEHEIMHALGFIHEHSRPDRDDFIEVNFKNIKKDEWNNFNKYKVHDINNLHEVFNFASILLYRNDAFTKNGQDTIASLEQPELKFGQRTKFSVGDVKEINHLYKCQKQLDKPNFHGLYKEYHTESRKKRRDFLRRRVIEKLREIEKQIHERERENIFV